VSALQRFENRLEQLISGVFARTFRSAVQPVEIASALNREVDNSAQILSRDRRLVPNNFHVELSEADHQRLEGLGPQLPRELTEMLREHAAEQSYVFTGPVSISLEVSDDLTTGRFRVRSKAIASSSLAGGDPSDTQVRRATATLELNGERLPLAPPGIVISNVYARLQPTSVPDSNAQRVRSSSARTLGSEKVSFSISLHDTHQSA